MPQHFGRHDQVRDVFHAALERSPLERAAYLKAECAHDVELEREVQRLLAAHEQAGSFLEHPVTPGGTQFFSLPAGTRVGPYEIVAALGAGGMGEVYRARDTQLKREVAIKVLPDAFSQDGDRLARFQREAELLATLNHGNIAAVYGLEKADGVTAIVLELVEGKTLADRLQRGAVPVEDTLKFALQIAEALEYAHEKGIVHRDLKPANVMITPDEKVKVLDFGLGKTMETAPAAANLTNSATLSMTATQAGVILGTAAYMSPEQAKGRPADKRSDVWAFGCVLYEMLTGNRAFHADGVSDTLAAVLRDEPDWHGCPSNVPPLLRALVAGCLKKDHRERIGDIAAALFALKQPRGTSSTSMQIEAGTPTLWKRAIPMLVVAIITSALTGSVLWRARSSPSPLVTRFSFPFAARSISTNLFAQPIAISPDGTRVVYTFGDRLYLRSMSELDAKPILGSDATVGAVMNPVFSPDGRSIAFSSGLPRLRGTLKRIAVDGGTATTVCETPSLFGATWDQSGILFADATKGVTRVPATGGTPELLIRVKDGETAQNPQMLPDGHTVLFAVAKRDLGTNTLGVNTWDDAQIVTQSLGSGERKVLIEGGSNARYVLTGHIVYARGGVLYAVPFDLSRLKVVGSAIAVVEGVMRAANSLTGAAFFAVSDTGSLVYVPAPALMARTTELAWVERNGRVERLILPPGSYEAPRISPDGTRVALGVNDGKDMNIWIYDLTGASSMRRLTFGGKNRFPVWSADGRHVAFQSDREGDLGIFWQLADGTGTAERLTKPEPGTSHVPESWLRNGDMFLFAASQQSLVSLWTFSLPEKKATPFGTVRSSFPLGSVFSPDGRWVAYSSNEGPLSSNAVYVEPFPPTGAKYLISKEDDGHHPLWSPDGAELFYVPGPNRFVRVTVSTRPAFSIGTPVDLPAGFLSYNPAFRRGFDIAPDGKRFVGIVDAAPPAGVATGSEVRVILNWFEDLKARITAK